MQKKYPKFFSTLRIVLAVVFVGIVGTLAGVLGGLISPQVFLPEDIIQLRPIVFEDKTTANKTQKDINISDVVRAIVPSMGELYHIPSKYRTRDFDEDLIPLAKDFLGYALVGTADGWIILPPSIANIHTDEIRFIDSEKHIFRIGNRITDVATGMQYAKITLPEDIALKPVQFDVTSDIGASKRVYEILNARNGIPFDLMGLEYPPGQVIADAIQIPSLLKKRFNAGQKFSIEGIPFVTEKKEIIGISTSQGIIPMVYVQNSFTQLLRTKKISHPRLALQYMDISLLPIGFSVPKRGLIKNGAYITVEKRPSVLHGPKGNLSFVQGDIITSINTETLDASKSLSEVIRQYKTGDTITIEYLHAGEKKTSEVTLQ